MVKVEVSGFKYAHDLQPDSRLSMEGYGGLLYELIDECGNQKCGLGWYVAVVNEAFDPVEQRVGTEE